MAVGRTMPELRLRLGHCLHVPERGVLCPRELIPTVLLHNIVHLLFPKRGKRPITLKFLGENIECKRLDIGLSNDFFGFDINDNTSKNEQLGRH